MERFASKKWLEVYEKIFAFIHEVNPFQYLFSFCDIFHLSHHCFLLLCLPTHVQVNLEPRSCWHPEEPSCSFHQTLAHQRSPSRISKGRIRQYQFLIWQKNSYPLMGLCCFSIGMIPKFLKRSYFIWKATIFKFTWSGWSFILSHLQALRTPPWRYELPCLIFFLSIHFQTSFSQILSFEML